MESSNIDQQHQLQQQLAAYSSLATVQSAHGSIISIHDWNPSIMLNEHDYNRYMNEILPNSKEICPINTSFIPLVQNTMFQDIGSIDARSYAHQSTSKQLFGNMNESISDSLIKSSDTNGRIFNTSHVKPKQQNVLDLNENLCLSSFSSKSQPTGHQLLTTADLYSDLNNSHRFSGLVTSSSHGYGYTPSTDYCNIGLSPSLVSSSPGLNLSMDSLTCINNGESSGQSYRSYCHRQESRGSPSKNSNKTTASRNGALKAKRQVNFTDVKPSHEEAKKPRAVSQSYSSSGLKVRKEKLGDRIAGLHRLVAPFGKTDTASVLTEAIGYIQFLQDQIQTLSMSYMKSSRSRRRGTIQVDPTMEDQKEDQPTQDLRSRGLCLVPLSFTSYMSSYTGGL